ncbi:2-oxoglutarate and iron-dependent oxygenase domain-containing protein 2 [Nymphon striatum]|nr:2-oxoglutarate and iron-dependent oxygenase domain-containing protein 2 [Nymphon striatum]
MLVMNCFSVLPGLTTRNTTQAHSESSSIFLFGVLEGLDEEETIDRKDSATLQQISAISQTETCITAAATCLTGCASTGWFLNLSCRTQCLATCTADVTINICLGHTFEGGKLKFGGLRESAYSSDCKEIIQKPGIGILHRGQHCHSATPIAEGRRTNLIIWMRASSVRNDLCPMCDKKPSLVYVEGH